MIQGKVGRFTALYHIRCMCTSHVTLQFIKYLPNILNDLSVKHVVTRLAHTGVREGANCGQQSVYLCYHHDATIDRIVI